MSLYMYYCSYLFSELEHNHCSTTKNKIYHIACNFRGAKYSCMVFVVGGLTTNILPTNEATLPTLPAVQAPTTKILPTKCLNIAEPRIFCPPKITRYTVTL